MTLEQAIATIRAKMEEIHTDADSSLHHASKRAREHYPRVTDMYNCDLGYYRDVVRHAWAARAKKIAMWELESTIEKIEQCTKQK